MVSRRGFVLLAAALVGVASAQEKPDRQRRGTVVGEATARGGYWIEVRADGEAKARRYFCGSDPVALKAVKGTDVGSRIRLEWRFEEVFRVVKIEVLRPAPKEKKAGP
jgi:hypothetical protein